MTAVAPRRRLLNLMIRARRFVRHHWHHEVNR